MTCLLQYIYLYYSDIYVLDGELDMALKFSKMHALGNDFVMIDAVRAALQLDAEVVQRLGDRHCGIGFDQLLVLLPPARADNDFSCVIYNSDGSRAGQCGNGMRCLMKFIHAHGLSARQSLQIELGDKQVQLQQLSSDYYQVDMGQANFAFTAVPFEPGYAQQQRDTLTAARIALADGSSVELLPLSLGNPHGVLFVDDVDNCAIDTLGACLSRHQFFPDRANIGFAEKVDAATLRLRVYERGVGETQACGSGACAAVVAGQEFLGLDAEVKVILPGGELTVVRASNRQDARIFLRGEAVEVFTGQIQL